MVFSDSIWKDCADTGRSTVAYIVFYQVLPINNCKHIPVPVSRSSSKNEYNTACTTGMDLAHFRTLHIESPNKDLYVVSEKEPLIILYIKSDLCMAKNGKEIKHTRHISRRMNFVRYGEECNLHKIVWYVRGLK